MEETKGKKENNIDESTPGSGPEQEVSASDKVQVNGDNSPTREDIDKNNKKLKLLEASIVKLNDIMEQSHWISVAETTEMVKRPWRSVYLNFLIGLSRGVGFAVGLIVLGTIVVYLLLQLLKNLGEVPVIGEYIADIVHYVQNSLDNH